MKFNSTFRSLNFHKTQEKTDVGFSTQEIEKIIRLKDIFISDMDKDVNEFAQHKKDFYNFINEYEKRRKYKCTEYYPELIQFIKNIENENKI